MSKNLGWRGAIVIFLVAMAFVYLTPSLSDDLPQWWSSFLPIEKIQLGIDLQGGMHLVLEVEAKKALESHLERVVEDLKHDLRKRKIRYLELNRYGTVGIGLALMREEDSIVFQDLAESNYADFKIETDINKEKGLGLQLILNPRAKVQIMKMAADQALETIRNRIDQFGVREPDIRPQENHRILIQLPGIKDPKRAIELIGKTALLEFKLVDEEGNLEGALKGNIPPGREILYQTSGKSPFLLKKRALLTGEYITDARVQIETQFNEPYVSLSFNARGSRLFERITGDNIEKRLAIVLDNHVYSAPVIRDKISGGRAQITGSFNMNEARDLAIVLRAGALPAPVKILEERTVGPSLGKDSIERGFKSMLIGGIVVLVFMIFYYVFSGVIADLALLLNILFIMAGLAFFGATLTLPGIAGIILTIGMAVDANVLIFERIKEELGKENSNIQAFDLGFKRSIVTILDANITTLIASVILFIFGSGPVKGFAVTLSIGLITTLFSAYFISRHLTSIIVFNNKEKKFLI